jgi:hypothetical protein
VLPVCLARQVRRGFLPLIKRCPVQGVRGETGAAGLPGATGEKGDPGITGSPGPLGMKGAEGPPGSKVTGE